eukprot:3356842-Amphidinium_carterae.1
MILFISSLWPEYVIASSPDATEYVSGSSKLLLHACRSSIAPPTRSCPRDDVQDKRDPGNAG